MKTKTITALIFALIAMLALSACGAEEPAGCLGTAEDAIYDMECQEVTFAVENAYLPFNYLVDGEPAGWDYDTFNEICTRLHCTPVYQEAAWDGMIQAVSDGQFDMAGDGITITAERDEIIDFSMGYVNISQQLLVMIGEDRFTSIEEFAADPDLLLGTQVNTTNYETAITFLPEDRVQAFEQYPFAVQALLAGDVDAVILDTVIGVGYMGENATEVELIGDPITSEQLGFAFPDGSELVELVDMALESMIADGTLNAINTQYFGPDFVLTYDDID